MCFRFLVLFSCGFLWCGVCVGWLLLRCALLEAVPKGKPAKQVLRCEAGPGRPCFRGCELAFPFDTPHTHHHTFLFNVGISLAKGVITSEARYLGLNDCFLGKSFNLSALSFFHLQNAGDGVPIAWCVVSCEWPLRHLTCH